MLYSLNSSEIDYGSSETGQRILENINELDNNIQEETDSYDS